MQIRCTVIAATTFMQTTFFLLAVLLLFSCSDKRPIQMIETSYWESLKDSFATKNLSNFVVDSNLKRTYKNFHRIRNRIIDSVVRYGTPYLYSWQESGSGRIEFTTFVDYGEHGSLIIYFIFDGRDSIRSATQVAGKGWDGGIVYESRSRFTAKDTLLKISAATTQWDLTKSAPPPKLSRPKGDSTFFYLIISKAGKVIEKQFAEKKELNLE